MLHGRAGILEEIKTTMSSPQERNTMPSKRQKVALNPSNDDIQTELADALKEEE